MDDGEAGMRAYRWREDARTDPVTGEYEKGMQFDVLATTREEAGRMLAKWAEDWNVNLDRGDWIPVKDQP